MKFDHIGVVVSELGSGRDVLASLFEMTAWTVEFDDALTGVSVQFGLDSSGICYEIIAPLGENSPIAQWLRKGVNILNHVAYLVGDIDAAGAKLRAAGSLPVLEPRPAVAYDNNRIQFYVTPLRIIIELIEAPHHHHTYIPITRAL